MKCICNLLKMNLLKSLSKKQLTSILGIILLVISSLWIYEFASNRLESERQTEQYNKLYEENELLKIEIDNLKEQNQSLIKVLDLKQNLE